MKVNGIERDFLKEVREARPEDCRRIIAALRAEVDTKDGYRNEAGELTPLGMLAAAIVEELAINGIMKYKYDDQKT